jgi:hypothetical protein
MIAARLGAVVEFGTDFRLSNRRLQLAATFGAARLAKCSVLVAKLDRLSRDVRLTQG